MSWGSFSDFLAMGGYGVYVWGSYGVTALLLALEIYLLLARRRAARRAASAARDPRNAA